MASRWGGLCSSACTNTIRIICQKYPPTLAKLLSKLHTVPHRRSQQRRLCWWPPTTPGKPTLGSVFVLVLICGQQGNAYEANGPPRCPGILSGILKRVLSERMAHPESEVIAYHKESGDYGKMRITVTFET